MSAELLVFLVHVNRKFNVIQFLLCFQQSTLLQSSVTSFYSLIFRIKMIVELLLLYLIFYYCLSSVIAIIH